MSNVPDTSSRFARPDEDERKFMGAPRVTDLREDGGNADARPVARGSRVLGLTGEPVQDFQAHLDDAEDFWKKKRGQAVRREKDHLLVDVCPRSQVAVKATGLHFAGELTDQAIEAGMHHVKHFWGGRMSINGGSEHEKMRSWAHAQIHGVEVVDYKPTGAMAMEAAREVERLKNKAMFAEQGVRGMQQKMMVPEPSRAIGNPATPAEAIGNRPRAGLAAATLNAGA
jgi:hypothetical protein